MEETRRHVSERKHENRRQRVKVGRKVTPPKAIFRERRPSSAPFESSRGTSEGVAGGARNKAKASGINAREKGKGLKTHIKQRGVSD